MSNSLMHWEHSSFLCFRFLVFPFPSSLDSSAVFLYNPSVLACSLLLQSETLHISHSYVKSSVLWQFQHPRHISVWFWGLLCLQNVFFFSCLLVSLVIFVEGRHVLRNRNEEHRISVWGFIFSWLCPGLCLLFAGAVVPQASYSSPALAFASPGDLGLLKVPLQRLLCWGPAGVGKVWAGGTFFSH